MVPANIIIRATRDITMTRRDGVMRLRKVLAVVPVLVISVLCCPSRLRHFRKAGASPTLSQWRKSPMTITASHRLSLPQRSLNSALSSQKNLPVGYRQGRAAAHPRRSRCKWCRSSICFRHGAGRFCRDLYSPFTFCLPANGDVWLRLAMVRSLRNASPMEVAVLMNFSQLYGPADANLIRGRFVMWQNFRGMHCPRP